MPSICLVSCVSAKKDHRTQVCELYISPLFKKARAYASTQFDRWYVLSAKHGLLNPNDVISPYDETLKNMSVKERKLWSEKVFLAIKNKSSTNDTISLIAGQKYREFLVPLLREAGYLIDVPMEGLSIGRQLAWLNTELYESDCKKHINRFYNLIDRLRNGVGGYRIINECTAKLDWPKRGVYFIFEPYEYRLNDEKTHRVTRIGTHAVSRGSKATLWQRIKAHKGTQNGLGNHRSSIFRLHVGQALINKSEKIVLDSWGKGQSSNKRISKKEAFLEKQVSEIIGNMSILWIEIEDIPSPKSDRAYIERNSIGLLTSIRVPYDPPSDKWLGLNSSRETIRSTGLWNLDYTKYLYNHNYLDVLEEYVEITIGNKPAPGKSIAPAGWYLTSKRLTDQRQIPLFEEK